MFIPRQPGRSATGPASPSRAEVIMTTPADDLPAVLPHDLPRSDDRTLLSLIRSLPLDTRQRAAACEMLVARLLAQSLSYLRERLLGPDEQPEDQLAAIGNS
jgi:hypothetical protein